MSGKFVLVVDDEPDIRSLLQEILEDEGHVVQTAGDAATARALVAEQRPDLVLLDIWMPDEDGVSLLKSWKNNNSLTFPVVMISGHGTIETAVEATRFGAVDFVEKPLSLAKLLLVVEKALNNTDNAAHDTKTGNVRAQPFLVGDSDYVVELRKQLESLAASTDNLFVFGQSGSGRELFARAVHEGSAHSTGPFVHLRCESLSGKSFQRELWGTETDGNVSSGYFESAAHGTLFLDNIEMLPRDAHSTVQDVIARNDFVRVGGSAHQSFSARVITAARSPLDSLLSKGLINQPLASQLSVQSAELLSLNRRSADIPALLEHLVAWHVDVEGLTYRHFTVAAQNRLRNRDWPGNLPELKNLVQRALILGGPTEIDVSEIDRLSGAVLAESAKQDGQIEATIALRYDLPLREARARFEREYLLRCLQESHGNMGDLAQHVGMERTHLYRKLRSLDIDLEKARE